MKKLYLLFILGIFLISLVGAYSPHQQNTNLDLIITSNNATQCNITSIQYGNGTAIINNYTMSRTGQTFNYTIESTNFSILGTTCIYLLCTDGSTYQDGSSCSEITPSGISQNSLFENPTLIILLVLSIVLILLGSYVRFPALGFIGGMIMTVAGVYTMIYGFNNYTDLYTRAAAGAMIGIGLLFTFVAAYEWFPSFGGGED